MTKAYRGVSLHNNKAYSRSMILVDDCLWPDVVFLLLVLWSAAYVAATRHFTFWTKRGVPYEPPVAFVGNLLDVLLSRVGVTGLLETLYRRYEGRPLVGLFAFHRPLLLVRDPLLVRKVLVQDFASFHDRSVQLDAELDPLATKNLFGMSGERWKTLRAKLTPTFTSGKLRRMFVLMNDIATKMADVVDVNAASGEAVAVKDVTSRYTLDVIACCVLGLPAEALQNPASPLRTHVHRANSFDVVKAFKFALAFFAPGVMKALRLRLEDADLGAYLRTTVLGHVASRRAQERGDGGQRGDFIDLLMQISDTDGRLDGDDLVAQCAIFLIAGYDTSANTMAFALYELALNQEIQEHLRAELLAVQDVNYESVAELSYLNQVVSETLRKYPPLPLLNRVATADCDLGDGILIPAGTSVVISVSGLHRDPAFHPDPEHFMPERFSQPTKPYTYLPFGDGPRSCIGSRVGLIQTKLGLAHLLKRFSVEPSVATPSPLQLDKNSLVMTAKGELPLIFRKLQ